MSISSPQPNYFYPVQIYNVVYTVNPQKTKGISNPFYVDKRYPDNIPGSNDIFTDIYQGRMPDRKILFENDTCFAIPTKHPANGVEGHCLIMPKRQIKSFFDLTPKEVLDCFDLLKKSKDLVKAHYNKDDVPFKLELYIGGTQSVPHTHFHLIPMIKP